MSDRDYWRARAEKAEALADQLAVALQDVRQYCEECWHPDAGAALDAWEEARRDEAELPVL